MFEPTPSWPFVKKSKVSTFLFTKIFGGSNFNLLHNIDNSNKNMNNKKLSLV